VRVVFTPYAERQIDAIHRYIAEHGYEQRADAYVVRLIEFCEHLARSPTRGTPRDEVLPGLRTTVFERRVTVAYLMEGDMVVVEGIYGRGRDFDADLR